MSREETTTSDYLEQIRKLGINPAKVHRNLEVTKLVSHSVSNGDGKIASTGSLAVKTGKYTGRSPDDRFIVKDNLTNDTVDWGKINHPIAPDKFDGIFERLKQHLEGKDLYVFDGFVGADPETRLPIRVINDHAWQNLFARQLFIRPTEIESASHVPEFNLVCINDFEAVPEDDGTNSNVFIMIDLSRKLVLIGGTKYAGEMKKSMFAVMNFILPQRNILPMHCSSNVGSDGHTALFFGLSGTGKTTLSADPERKLVGDDEHGWSDSGVFNFEGGCYAKCINLRCGWTSKFITSNIDFFIDRRTLIQKISTSLRERSTMMNTLEFVPSSSGTASKSFIHTRLNSGTCDADSISVGRMKSCRAKRFCQA